MDLTILDGNLTAIGIYDEAESIIWTPGYAQMGEFEIYTRADIKAITLLRCGHFVQREDSDMVGVIEHIEIATDPEARNYLTATGRCLKSIVGRRVVWKQTNLSGNVEAAVRRLVTENIIAPEDPDRAVPGFVLGDAAGLTATFTEQVTGDNLAEYIIGVCETFGYGWRVRLQDGCMMFEMYEGVDRSGAQIENPWVTFSPGFDNLTASEYSYDMQAACNVALVAGEGEGTARVRAQYGAFSGMTRREMYVDARDLSSETDDGVLSAAAYTAALQQRGAEKLAENMPQVHFEGEVAATSYVFGRDYGLGDIVDVMNEYGIYGRARVIGMTDSCGVEGHVQIPTLEELEVMQLWP